MESTAELMDPGDILAAADWYKALTLSERAAAGRAAGVPPAAPPDADRAARILARWQAQSPRDGVFRRRLAREGMDLADLLALLGETPDSLASRAGAARPPAWLQELAAAFTTAPTAPFPAAALTPDHQGTLLELVRPLLDRGFSRLTEQLRALAAASGTRLFEPGQAAASLAGAIGPRLLFLLKRTLAVELHLAAQDNRLTGDTAEDRYASFVAWLREPGVALALLRQYPVAARQAVECIGRWVDAGAELCAHLVADAPRLGVLVAGRQDLGTLVEVRTGLGDLHRGGRSVTRLRFDSGVELIYKPRSMAVEATFQQLLAWTERHGFAPGWQLLPVLDAGDHGWAAVVTAHPCADAAQVERFYQRQGGYLALLYLLSATDMHHENLIAAGEHPFLVDLEALFHPLDQTWGHATPPQTPLPDTVLRVGLLPDASWGGKGDQDGIDLSGLAATAGQVIPQPILRVTDAGTDRMRFLHQHLEAPVGGEHRPTLGGADVPLAPYVDAVAQGCERMLRLLARHRDQLLAPDGPLAAFAHHPVRVLVRLTMAYGTLLADSHHPFVLGDGLERDRLLDRLWTIAGDYPELERLVPAEHRDLQHGDIPMFTTWPDSRDVQTSDGEILTDVLDRSGLDAVGDRLRRLDDADVARQVWIVRNSLAGAAAVPAPPSDYQLVAAASSPAADQLLVAALAVGRRLEALAFRRGRGAVWFGPEPQANALKSMLAPAGPDLYLGSPGIALFLGYLGAVTGEAWAADLARAATVTMLEQAAPTSTLLSSIGAFAGWGGVLYTLTHLAALWDDAALLDQAEACALRLAPEIARDPHGDVVAGAAGCLVCLLGLWRTRGAHWLLQLAVQCGDRLLELAQPMERGLGWIIPLAGPRPLAGFAHGAAGISWALLQLAEATGAARYRDAALAALDYERSLYAAELGNWPDLRAGAEVVPGQPHFMCAWCHGAPGIALGRLDSLRRLSGDDLALARTEAQAALRTTLAGGFGKGHSLCHGDLGNLEALTLAATVLDDPDLAARAGRLAGGILADIRRHGWRLGIAVAAEAPGLMIGLAGIGHGLLRVAAPHRVPAVVRLAPPPES